MWLQAGGVSSLGKNSTPSVHHHVVTSHSCVPQSAADQSVGIPCCHGAAIHTRHVLILAGEQIFTEREWCGRADLDSRELGETWPSYQQGLRQIPSAACQAMSQRANSFGVRG